MKSFTKYFCLCLAFLLPLAAHAKFTGEVFFKPPIEEERYNELWITHIEDPRNARLLYKHNEGERINNYAIQKDGPNIVISAGPGISDLFLINRNRLRAGARNLTQKRFNRTTTRVDISINGDILFTNAPTAPFPEVVIGLYLIPNNEVRKAKPEATLLLEEDKVGLIDFIRWSPNGYQFLYQARNGLFLYNLHTREDSLITKDNSYLVPTFSPDGKKLAFIYQPKIEPGVELDVISLETLYPELLPDDPNSHLRFSRLKWPTENYLVYRKHNKQTKKTKHFVIRVDGGHPEQILEDMEDMFENGLAGFKLGNATFAVEPTNRLTTVWGELKTNTLK